MAEKLLAARVAELRLHDSITAASLGTYAIDGLAADPKAIRVMQERGLDLRNHRSRLLTETNIQVHRRVLVMENSHKEALQYEFPAQASSVFLLSEMIGHQFEIPDPVGKPIQEFRKTAELLNEIILSGFTRIVED
jgi:protein-tyrosine-phosphatase